MENFNAALNLDSNTKYCIAAISNAYAFGKKDFDQANENYTKALLIDPNYKWAKSRLDLYLWHKNYHEKKDKIK